jgi:hypothetical protein
MRSGRKQMSIVRKGTPNWRIHPGEILREEFLKPMSITAYALAKRIRVPPPRINDIVLERRGITADTRFACPGSSEPPNSSG